MKPQSHDTSSNPDEDNTLPAETADQEHGEGNYIASKTYNDATKKFVESGKVEEAARAAEPQSESEAKELEDAEEEGRSHTKGEDPAIAPRKSTP